MPGPGRRGVRVPSYAEVLHRVGARIDAGKASVVPERDPQMAVHDRRATEFRGPG